MLDGNSIRKTEGAAPRAPVGASQDRMVSENYHPERVGATTKSDQRKVAEVLADGLMVLPPAGGLPPLLRSNGKNGAPPAPPVTEPARQNADNVASIPGVQQPASHRPPALNTPVQDNEINRVPPTSAGVQVEAVPVVQKSAQRPQLHAVPQPDANVHKQSMPDPIGSDNVQTDVSVQAGQPSIDELLTLMSEAQAAMQESQQVMEQEMAGDLAASGLDMSADSAVNVAGDESPAPQSEIQSNIVTSQQPATPQPPAMDEVMALVRAAAKTAAEAEILRSEQEQMDAERIEAEQLEADRIAAEQVAAERLNAQHLRQQAQDAALAQQAAQPQVAAAASTVNQPRLQRANYIDVANQPAQAAAAQSPAMASAARPDPEPEYHGSQPSAYAGHSAGQPQPQYQPQQPGQFAGPYAGQYPGGYTHPYGAPYQNAHPGYYPGMPPHPASPYQAMPQPMVQYQPQPYFAPPPPQPVYYQQPVALPPQPAPAPQVVQHVFSAAAQPQAAPMAQHAPASADHHPSPGEAMMASLLQHLPPPGEVWPEQVRRKWLRAAGNMFEIAYGDVRNRQN